MSSESKNEASLYDHQTLFEINLIADTHITRSKRSSIQMLDLMGEIGGFYEAIFIMIGLFTNSISSRLFKGNLARAFYLVKKSYQNEKTTDKVDTENQTEGTYE